ncbi:hypothetical protein AGLY_010084, partial [Aphis glycines]
MLHRLRTTGLWFDKKINKIHLSLRSKSKKASRNTAFQESANLFPSSCFSQMLQILKNFQCMTFINFKYCSIILQTDLLFSILETFTDLLQTVINSFIRNPSPISCHTVLYNFNRIMNNELLCLMIIHTIFYYTTTRAHGYHQLYKIYKNVTSFCLAEASRNTAFQESANLRPSSFLVPEFCLSVMFGFTNSQIISLGQLVLELNDPS